MSKSPTHLASHLACLAAFALATVAAQAQITPVSKLTLAAPAMFLDGTVSEQDVLQGDIGTCYFYGSIAALAHSRPTLLHDSIVTVSKGTYKVTFADAKTELVTEDDAMYARRNSFDHSRAFWVPVLFRAYAQRALREALSASVDSTQAPVFFKEAAKTYVANNDMVLMAYDRAIREQVYQNGSYDKGQLETSLKKQMDLLQIAKPLQAQVTEYLNNGDFLKTLATKLDENGEFFGAYRAAGQGGIPAHVFELFGGSSEDLDIDPNHLDKSVADLTRIHASSLAAVASTKVTIPPELLARLRADTAHSDWWVPDHAYTLVDYDAAASTVTLRNPWGNHPTPDGMFTISQQDFLTGFEHMTVTKSPTATAAGKPSRPVSSPARK
jgi:hypothetical protein